MSLIVNTIKMEKLLFNDLPEKERVEMLEANSDGVEEMEYTEFLTPEELTEHKDLLAQRSIEESRILDEKQEAVEGFKQQLKPIVEEKNRLLTEIKHGSRSLYGRCFKLIDYQDQQVGYYNPRGQLVYSRPSKPEERQRTIMSVKRTGTNN